MKRFPVRALRPLELALFLVALLAVIGDGRSARAAEAEPTLHVTTGLYTSTREGDALTWRARWILAPDAIAPLASGQAAVLRFATPLPAGERLVFAPGVEPVVEDGHLAAVRVTAAALDSSEPSRTIRAELVQPLPRDARAFELGAPIAAGAAVQIVDGALDANRRLEPDPGGTLEAHVGHVAPRAVGHDARVHARALTGYAQRLTGDPIYVRGDDVVAMHGLRAHVVDQRDVARRGTLVLGALFALGVLALGLVVVRLRRAASAERADAILAAEIDEIHTIDAAGAR